MKKKLRSLALLVSIAVLGFQIYSTYQEVQKRKRLEEDTVSYLEDRGYKMETDIDNLSIVYATLDKKVYMAVVTFQDESEARYFYWRKRDSNEIEQIDVIHHGTSPTLKREEN
ncbi:hypothetical protein BEP19_12750 [Ammoniphilus oxalaticus]|uniref:DUF3139 domain-containing protein n=1 Tax=Ammoniphilus oxalaticus TaxID=66863 RepID=A0A419SH31_9BACL|nr:DUF3139 domain-containing protein [Ammoniphilus oxalaticus]RKD23088.1 hypothetical protein BEP19_12750 [Ammoniphilus oxalaticus]